MVIKFSNDYESRKAKAEENKRKILRFLRDETWTTLEVLSTLLDYKYPHGASRILNSMQRAEMVKSSKVSIPQTVNIWGITSHGLAMSYDDGEPMEERPVFEPSRITISTLIHRIEIQKTRLKGERSGWSDWFNGSHLGFKGTYRPDAIFTRPDGVRVAIEVERTIKTKKRYADIIGKHVSEIASTNPSWIGVYYLVPDKVHQNRLEALFSSVEVINVSGSQAPFNDAYRKRFKFMTFDDFPNGGE